MTLDSITMSNVEGGESPSVNITLGGIIASNGKKQFFLGLDKKKETLIYSQWHGTITVQEGGQKFEAGWQQVTQPIDLKKKPGGNKIAPLKAVGRPYERW